VHISVVEMCTKINILIKGFDDIVDRRIIADIALCHYGCGVSLLPLLPLGRSAYRGPRRRNMILLKKPNKPDLLPF